MKKHVSLLLALAVLLSALTGVVLSSNAASAKPVHATGGITVDGDLAEWAGVDTLPLSIYNSATGAWEPSTTEYVQFAFSNDSVYFAITTTDVQAETTTDIGQNLRDHIVLSMCMPDGTMGIAYMDEDKNNGYFGDQIVGFYGGTNGTVPLFEGANHSAVFAVDAENNCVVEGRVQVVEAYRAQLVNGAKVKVAIQYLDHESFTNSNYGSTKWAAYGTTVRNTTVASAITGELTLGEKIPVVYPDATATAVPKDDGIAEGRITVDGVLTDWDGIASTPLSAYNGSTFVTSDEEYVQFAWSEDSLYFTVVVNDVANVSESLNRDHVRFSVLLPNGELGLFYCGDAYGDTNMWNATADAFSWWGATGSNAFQVGDTSGIITHRDGKTFIEGRTCLAENQRAQLTAGAELKVALQYFDHMSPVATDYDGAHWAAYGAETIMPIDAEAITGTVTLAAMPGSGDDTGSGDATSPSYTGTAVAAGAEAEPDGDFFEWENVEKYPMDVRQSNGSFTASSDEYVQFLYRYGQLYFRIHAKDDGPTKSGDQGLNRDGVRLCVFFPGGERAYFYTDNDNFYMCTAPCWYEGLEEATALANNAAIVDNSMSTYVYADGYVDLEGRINCRDAVKDYFTNGTELKVGIQYFDGQYCAGTTYDGNRWLRWGCTDIVSGKPEQVTGVVTLYDPNFRDTDNLEAVEPTAGTENIGYSFDADGQLVATVKPVEGAVSYRINLFDNWDGTYIANTYEPSETTTLVIGDLTADAFYAYQVWALDAEGNMLAAYPLVEFVAGQLDDGNGGSGGNVDDGNDGDITVDGDSPITGDTLPILAAVFALASGIVLLAVKSRNKNIGK